MGRARRATYGRRAVAEEIGSLAEYVYDEDTGSVLISALNDDGDANVGARWLTVDSATGAVTLADARTTRCWLGRSPCSPLAT